MNKLIVAEKPSVASRIAASLSDSAKRNFVNGVTYYELSNGGDTIYVVAAAGHLFTLKQKGDFRGYPIFDIEWVPSYTVNKGAYFTKKYLDVAEMMGKKCDTFINACDYDREGTVIGTNIIKAILKSNFQSSLDSGKIKRMRFSTTTNSDLISAYSALNNFDYNNFDAGEVRHMLDWMWGINLSRALMHSLSSIGIRRIISIGRVQGPTLAILAGREMEIKNFKPQPYWKLMMKAFGVQFENKRGDIFEKSVAEEALEKSKGAETYVKDVNRREEKIGPNPPFDLTVLQLEASRTLRIDPSRTLAIAQSLYERSYISYPRTASQKLPYTLNLPKIISEIAKNPRYSDLANILISSSRFKPVEGGKEDEAHPSIFPTGVIPTKLTDEEQKLYDLIVKRFLSCFAEWATVERSSITLDANGELYGASGTVIKQKGWISFYEPYARMDENMLPDVKVGDKVKPEKLGIKELETKPPKRYTKASLIALLERKDLGTKATRAEIIDTLFKREYIKGAMIETTEFGLSVHNALNKYGEEILDEELTKNLESDIEKVAKGEIKEEKVIDEGKEIIVKIIDKFKKNEKEIGGELKEGLKESESANAIGVCKKCGGNLVVKMSKKGNRFVGCSNWPNCTNSYPLPYGSNIVPTKKICPLCGTPIVKVFRRGKRVFEMDLDPNCESKKDWGKPKEVQVPKPKRASEIVAKESAVVQKTEAAPSVPKVTKAKKEIKKKTAKKPKTKKIAKK